ncbi:MAG: AI-2E family transporter [Clostridium sp.]
MISINKTFFKGILLTIIVILILKLSLVFLWPFLFALILTLSIEPVIVYLMRFKVDRKTAVILTFALGGILVFVFGAYIWQYVATKIVQVTDIMPRLLDTYKDYPLISSFNDNYEKIILEAKNIILQYKEKILHTVMTALGGSIYVFILALASFLMSLDLPYLASKVKGILGNSIYSVIRKSVYNINTLITIEIRLVAITIAITSISLMILGFQDPLSIGIICGILDLLPIVGPLFIFLPIVLYTFISKQYFICFGLVVTILLLIIVRQVAEIKLMQGNLVLKPIFVLFSLYIGVTLFGTMGVLFGPLILVMFKEIYKGIEKGDLTYR